MSVAYCCPIHREPLSLADGMLVGSRGGERYPIVDSIPLLLPDRDERARAPQTAWSISSGGRGALDFYNQTRDHDGYCREQLDDTRKAILAWKDRLAIKGPALEIGSGKGPLQGIGEPYVALDYSLTALRQYVRPEFQRVCATAERLPFFDGAFSLVFTVAALEHVPRAGDAFDEIHRVLRPGGLAYLWPAWHCVQYNCEGIPVRPYRDLTAGQKLVKLSLLVRKRPLAKAVAALPGRAARRAFWALRRGPTAMRYRRLRPDYERFWMSDSDAASRLDSHEAALYFHSRGYRVHQPGAGTLQQLLTRHVAVIVQRPG